MSKVAVIGAGSWGTALATVVSGKGHEVRLWARNDQQRESMKENRENIKYLPNIKFDDCIEVKDEIKDAVADADVVLFSVPTQAFRKTYQNALDYMDDKQIVVNVAKGIEQSTLMTLSQVAKDINPNVKYAVLSGPSHAEEVGLKLPTTVAVASDSEEVAKFVQDLFFTDRFRTYVNDDVIGVELGGALKNIIALGAGISDGMGFGDNAKAALMTRGLTEISRLGIALGAKQETFAGLTGMGDLIVTCTSMHSRNRRCGIMIGDGLSPKEATEKIGMVVESMFTTEAAYGLAQKVKVEMPITEKIYEVINGKIKAAEAVDILMGRKRKHEKV